MVPGPLSDQYIYNWLYSGMSIYANLTRSDGDSAHAVVVCQCQNTSNGVFTVTVMNPGHGALEVMSKNSNRILSLNYNSSYYDWDAGSVVLTGWQKPGNIKKWVYTPATDGKYVTGWQVIGGTTYYFDEEGYMYEEQWQPAGLKWYYLKSGGAMAKSEWLSISGYWYAFNNAGAMRTGWYEENGKFYYLRTAQNSPGTGPEGSMLCNGTWTIGGSSYTFNASGVCLNLV